MRLFTFILLFFISKTGLAAWGHLPPGMPEQGYGSAENYIADAWTVTEQGAAADGDLTWLYVPNELKYGDSAPVVVYLHGFAALSPNLYKTHIEHLLRQGNIVVFPLFQKSTLWGFLTESGLFSPVDQSVWAARAVESVDRALATVDGSVAWDQVYLYGHSLGGLISLAWQAEGGVPVNTIVLSHAQVDASAGMPDFVRSLVKIIEIPWRDYAPDIDVPVVILNGEEDEIATIEQNEDVAARLTNSPNVQFYIAQSDYYGYPFISPNHGAPLDFIVGLPAHLKIFSISGELNVLDWRFYFAALDSVMDGNEMLTFELGSWSDGTPLRPVYDGLAE